MRIFFAILGILLILSGALVLGAPYLSQLQGSDATFTEQNAAPGGPEQRRLRRPRPQTWLSQARDLAEKANAPLSILFGIMSLYYTRRTYHAQRDR